MAIVRTRSWRDKEVTSRFLSTAGLMLYLYFGLLYEVDLALNHEELPTSCCCINVELILPDGVSNRSAKGYRLAEVDVTRKEKIWLK